MTLFSKAGGEMVTNGMLAFFPSSLWFRTGWFQSYWLFLFFFSVLPIFSTFKIRYCLSYGDMAASLVLLTEAICW